MANVAGMSVTFVDMFQKNSPEARIFDMAIGVVVVHEDKQVVVAHKVMDRPETEGGFVGKV